MENREQNRKPRQVIIEQPGSLSTKRRYGERTINLVSWGFWVLLFRPLIVLILWVLGIRLAFMEIYKAESAPIWQTYLTYLFGVSMIYALLQAWNRYNVMRFRGKERRRRVKDATEEEMSSYFQISKEDLQNLKKWRKANITFLHDHRLVFETGDVGGKKVFESGAALKLNTVNQNAN